MSGQDAVTRSGVWYEDGLHFSCTRCGDCCTGGPGTVRIADAEVDALATHLAMSAAEFRERYTREVGDNELSLREKLNHDCIFWNAESGCTVYAHRPKQCRAWPFWYVNVSSRASWDYAATTCPGMDQGQLFSADHIERTSADDGTLGSARRSRRTE